MKKIILTVICALCCTAPTWSSVGVPGEHQTIQAAINAANEGDTVIVADGLYTGEGNRDLDFKGKNIVLKSQNGPSATIIDCEGTEEEYHCAFLLNSGEDTSAVIQGFTITGAYGKEWYDAAVKCNGSYPTLRECIIAGNNCAGVRYDGFSIDSYFQMFDCVVSHNEGHGVMAMATAATIADCELSHNRRNGIFLSAQWYGFYFSMSSCLVDGNDEVGVSLLMGSALLHVHNCTIVNNRIGLEYEWDFPKLNGETISLATVDTSTIENNIMAFNSLYGMNSSVWAGPIKSQCNNAYGNLVEDYHDIGVGPDYVYENISADPLFCDTANADYTIKPESPCAPENNACGLLIGKYEALCAPTTTTDDPDVSLPRDYALRQNYPNPFNPATRISLELPVATHVRLEVFNLLGHKVSTLIDRELSAGYHYADWDARDQASGIYFYRVQTEDFTESKAMILLK